MADKIPVKAIYTFADVTSLGEFNPGDTIPVANGGTGAVDATEARTNLGLASMAIQESDNVEITGGTIDGTVIGGAVPVEVHATTLSASGLIKTTDGAEFGWGAGTTGFVGNSASAYIDTYTNGVARTHLSDSGLIITGALSTLDAWVGATPGAKTTTSITIGSNNNDNTGGSQSSIVKMDFLTGGEVGAYIGAKYNLYEDSTTSIVFGTRNGAGSPSEKMRLDAAGNLGLGVTPSAFPSTRTLEMPNGVMFSSWQGYSTYGILQNNYHDGVSWKYKTAAHASRFCANDGNVGGFQWYTAPSWNGTGDNTITFTQAMVLDAAGNLAIVNGFGCNGATPQTEASVNAASTDLASVIALCNQLRAALVANGICV